MSHKRNSSDYWLAKRKTIRKLWMVLVIVLILSVTSDLLFDSHGKFIVNDTFGFSAWFGLGCCAAMIFVSKGLGFFLKRKENFYFDDGEKSNSSKNSGGE